MRSMRDREGEQRDTNDGQGGKELTVMLLYMQEEACAQAHERLSP